MKNFSKLMGLLFISAVLLAGVGCSGSDSSAVAVPAADGSPKNSVDGEEILPKVVVDAVIAAFPNGTIQGGEMETENGETVYEVEVTVDGKRLEVEIDANGQILEIEDEDGEEDDSGDEDDEVGGEDD